MSEEHKVSCEVTGKSNRHDRIHNLEQNINLRGVRQGGFRILFDKNGALMPIKLNKDHAFTIIAPSPENLENIYPHVLMNVCEERVVKTTAIMQSVKDFLQIPDEYTGKELVMHIWQHFYEMVCILKKDPNPKLLPGFKAGSKCANHYQWYSCKDYLQIYKFHAETFFPAFQTEVWSKTYNTIHVKVHRHSPIVY